MNTKSPVVQAGPNLHTCNTISSSRTNLEILYTDWVRNMNIQGKSRNSLSSYNKIYIHGTDDKYKKTTWTFHINFHFPSYHLIWNYTVKLGNKELFGCPKIVP